MKNTGESARNQEILLRETVRFKFAIWLHHTFAPTLVAHRPSAQQRDRMREEMDAEMVDVDPYSNSNTPEPPLIEEVPQEESSDGEAGSTAHKKHCRMCL